MMRAHCHPAQSLGHMCAVAFEGGRAQCGPDKPLGDVGIVGIEGFQIGVGLPLFEQPFDLSAQAITVGDVVDTEVATGQMSEQITQAVLAGMGVCDEPEVDILALPREAHIQVHGFTSGDACGNLVETLALPTLDLRAVGGPGVDNNGIHAGGAAHDEGATGVVHLGERVPGEVAAIHEQQRTVQLVRQRQKLPLTLTVGGQHHAAASGSHHQLLPLTLTVGGQHHGIHRVAEQIQIDVQFHGRGAGRGEAPGEHCRQRAFQGKGCAILRTDVVKLGKGTVGGPVQDVTGQIIEQPTEQPAQVGGELHLGEWLVKRFVLHGLVTQRVDGTVHVGDGQAFEKRDAQSRWITALVQRRNANIAAVAVANKPVLNTVEGNARVMWALLRHDEDYRVPGLVSA